MSPFQRDPIQTARDLANYSRRSGRRIVLVTGTFDVITPADADQIHGQTNDMGDDLVVAVDQNPSEADLEARLRLAHLLIHPPNYGLAVAVDPLDSALAEAIRPDVTIALGHKPEPAGA